MIDPTVAQLVDDLDDSSLLVAVSANDQHVLRYYYNRSQRSFVLSRYSRPRRHQLLLATERDSSNFVERQY